MEDEYQIENDNELMKFINHYAKISNNENYRYWFIEIMKRIKFEDAVHLKDLKDIDKAFKCHIVDKLVKCSELYLGEQISSIADINRFLGERKGKYKDCKLDFYNLRKAMVSDI